jgi:hypothetical protein
MSMTPRDQTYFSQSSSFIQYLRFLVTTVYSMYVMFTYVFLFATVFL